jgi:hypothetical protein
MLRDLILNGAGVLGAATYLSAYAAVQLGRIDGNGRTYTILNTVASGLVLASLTISFNAASAVIQIAWLSIGCCSLLARRPRS